MSLASMSARMKRVEAHASGGVRAILWAESGQDAAAVEADHVAGHPQDAGRVLVLGWAETPR